MAFESAYLATRTSPSRALLHDRALVLCSMPRIATSVASGSQRATQRSLARPASAWDRTRILFATYVKVGGRWRDHVPSPCSRRLVETRRALLGDSGTQVMRRNAGAQWIASRSLASCAASTWNVPAAVHELKAHRCPRPDPRGMREARGRPPRHSQADSRSIHIHYH